MFLKKLFFVILFVFLVINSFIFAISGGVENIDIDVKISPRFPAPYDSVKFNLNSYYLDLDSTKISIYTNSLLLKSGYGVKEFYVVTGAPGDKKNIRIEFEPRGADKIVKTYAINPAEVSLIYEPIEPYRPFGYQGKSIALSDSVLRVKAFTNMANSSGEVFNDSQLIYRWYYNYEFVPEKSGFGKKEFIIKRLPAYPRKTNLTVKVFAPDGSSVAKDEINFEPKKTKTEFYLIDPALPFNFKNVSNPDIISSYLDSDVMAVPYFMNLMNSNIFTWKINDKLATPFSDDPLKITLTNSLKNFIGEVSLFLRVKSPKRILQSSETKIKVNFDAEKIKEKNTLEDDKFYNKKDEGSKKSGGGLFGIL